MTDAELSALEAAARAATPGPWKRKNAQGVLLKDEIHSENGALVAMALAKRHPLNGEQYVGYEQTESNAAFIAAANPTVIIELIAELKKERNCLTNWIARAIWLARQLESKDIPWEDWLQKSIEGADKECIEFEKMLEEIKHD